MYCDNCIYKKSCFNERLVDRPIVEFDDGSVWCRRKFSQEQKIVIEKLYNSWMIKNNERKK